MRFKKVTVMQKHFFFIVSEFRLLRWFFIAALCNQQKLWNITWVVYESIDKWQHVCDQYTLIYVRSLDRIPAYYLPARPHTYMNLFYVTTFNKTDGHTDSSVSLVVSYGFVCKDTSLYAIHKVQNISCTVGQVNKSCLWVQWSLNRPAHGLSI